MHILTTISWIEGYQATKFDQLVEYNMRNNFFKKYTKCGGETIPSSFSEKLSPVAFTAWDIKQYL